MKTSEINLWLKKDKIIRKSILHAGVRANVSNKRSVYTLSSKDKMIQIYAEMEKPNDMTDRCVSYEVNRDGRVDKAMLSKHIPERHIHGIREPLEKFIMDRRVPVENKFYWQIAYEFNCTILGHGPKIIDAINDTERKCTHSTAYGKDYVLLYPEDVFIDYTPLDQYDIYRFIRLFKKEFAPQVGRTFKKISLLTNHDWFGRTNGRWKREYETELYFHDAAIIKWLDDANGNNGNEDITDFL